MKHITGLAHIALFTKDLETSIKFYECLGGKVTGQADVQKPLGTNHIKIVSMPGFDLEIIEPHDGTDVTAQGGLFPHIAIEVNDIDAAIADLKAAGSQTSGAVSTRQLTSRSSAASATRFYRTERRTAGAFTASVIRLTADHADHCNLST